MTSLLNRIRRRRTTSPQTTSTTPSITNTTPTRSNEPSTPTQPVAEELTQHEPPPYYSSSSSTPPTTTQPDTSPESNAQQNGRVVVSYDITQGLLDPNLNFTAAQMEQQWKRKDVIFARAVVQFIAERFDGNLKGWAGYKYTYICEVRPSPMLEPPVTNSYKTLLY
jgi:hypothetical protein